MVCSLTSLDASLNLYKRAVTLKRTRSKHQGHMLHCLPINLAAQLTPPSQHHFWVCTANVLYKYLNFIISIKPDAKWKCFKVYNSIGSFPLDALHLRLYTILLTGYFQLMLAKRGTRCSSDFNASDLQKQRAQVNHADRTGNTTRLTCS